MDKQVRFSHILTILGILIIPLIIWGVNVERRFEKVITNSGEIKELKTNYSNSVRQMNDNHIEVMDKLHTIELQVKDKADRK